MKHLFCIITLACSLTAIGEPDRTTQNHGDREAYKRMVANSVATTASMHTTAPNNSFLKVSPQDTAIYMRGIRVPQKGS